MSLLVFYAFNLKIKTKIKQYGQCLTHNYKNITLWRWRRSTNPAAPKYTWAYLNACNHTPFFYYLRCRTNLNTCATKKQINNKSINCGSYTKCVSMLLDMRSREQFSYLDYDHFNEELTSLEHFFLWALKFQSFLSCILINYFCFWFFVLF